MSDAIRARKRGDRYQAYVFWDKICDMLLEPQKYSKVYYEYSEIKSFDDIVVEYKNDQGIQSQMPYRKEYYQVKFHMRKEEYITLESLMTPKYIGASESSILKNLKKVWDKLGEDMLKCRFYLYTTHSIEQHDVLDKLVSSYDFSWELNVLFNKNSSSEIREARRKMCEYMDVKEDVLKKILSVFKIKHNQWELHKLVEMINAKLSSPLLQMKRIDLNSANQEYVSLVDQWIDERVKKFDVEYIKKIIREFQLDEQRTNKETIFVQSFLPKGELPQVDYCVDLNKYFLAEKANRCLIEGCQWNKEIIDTIDHFKCTSLVMNKQYELHFSTHLSIAFYLGYVLNSKQGYHIFPMQRNVMTNETECWTSDSSDRKRYPTGELVIREEGNGIDSVLVLGFPNNIMDAVKDYFQENPITYSKVFEYQYDSDENGEKFIENGNHAWSIVNYICNELDRRTLQEKRGTLHIFAKAPAAMMFMLGQKASSFGKVQMYEYDFDKTNTCTYSPSIQCKMGL